MLEFLVFILASVCAWGVITLMEIRDALRKIIDIVDEL